MPDSNSEKNPPESIPFFFIGNQPALDFANTLAATREGPLELLPDWAPFARWLELSHLADPVKARRLGHGWSPRQRESFLAEARRYRAEIKAAASALDRQIGIPATFVEETNRLLRAAQAVVQVESAGTGFYQRRRAVDWSRPASVMGLLAESGLSLLCDCENSLVRKCENPACVLYFYDTTKNHQRRWCSMEACGNRHKAALHRQKLRNTAAD